MGKNVLILVFLASTFTAIPNYGISSNTTGLIPPLLQMLDPTLINGKQYTYFIANVKGHQFLDKDFKTGTLTIKGKTYTNQELKYDIYNQLLLLKFTNQFNSEKIIVVSDAWLTEFTIGEAMFKIDTLHGSKRIVQAIDSKNISLCFEWKKVLKLDPSTGIYHFSSPIRKGFLLLNGKELEFRGNRSFAKQFGRERSKQILQFLRKQKIKIYKAPDRRLMDLLNYCNTFD